jgi:anti-sigma B factor antagonist
MNLSTTTSAAVTIITLHEKRLDAKIAVAFKERLTEIINAGNLLIVLDLTHVEFVDSSGLGAIVTGLKVLGRRGDLALANVHADVKMMLSLTRMDRVFKVFASTDEAVTALSA